MLSRESTLPQFQRVIRKCLVSLYDNDQDILDRNELRGVSERTIVFRFAHYMQNKIRNYYVDCDFNASFEAFYNSDGELIIQQRNGKPISNPDGSVTKRFVDIIIHKRESNLENDLICIEIKKWNNHNSIDIKKDRNNLRIMTTKYGYVYGFHITISRMKSESKWTIYEDGVQVVRGARIFV
jgi:hypothetical protein